MRKTTRPNPRVALLIETSRGYGRKMLRGISRYARLHGPWRFYVTPGDFEQALPSMQAWGGTGIIARVETPKVAQAILAAKLPTILLDASQNLSHEIPGLDQFSEIISDSRGAARMAAEHLLSRGFRNLAFVGEAGRGWSTVREEAFAERVREAGLEPMIYRPPQKKSERAWGREQQRLADWLVALPRPTGVMACNDDRGRQVLDACRAAGIVVPVEMAVIGVDDDELLCELADPALTSVALNSEAGGYRAAELLDMMMRAEVRKPQRLVVEPMGVVERRSTEAAAMANPDVAHALEFIHLQAASPIGVDDLVRVTNISRRALELGFRNEIGRTPHQELLRVRLNRACQLLRESNLSTSQVAAAAGFRSAAYLAQVFRKELGVPPSRFRRKAAP